MKAFKKPFSWAYVLGLYLYCSIFVPVAVVADDLAPEHIKNKFETAQTFDAFLLTAKNTVNLLNISKKAANISRDETFERIDRATAFRAFEKLVRQEVPCEMMRGAIVFGYFPRRNEVADTELSLATREVIALIPAYCRAHMSRG